MQNNILKTNNTNTKLKPATRCCVFYCFVFFLLALCHPTVD